MCVCVCVCVCVCGLSGLLTLESFFPLQLLIVNHKGGSLSGGAPVLGFRV